jgi:hypothetical protein
LNDEKSLKRLDNEKLEGTQCNFGSEGWGFKSLRARHEIKAARKVFASSVAEMFPALFALFFSDIAGLVSADASFSFNRNRKETPK